MANNLCCHLWDVLSLKKKKFNNAALKNSILCTLTVKYKQYDCLGAGVKLRFILLRTCTCVVILHLYRNKLDVAERGSRGRRSRLEVWGVRPFLWGPGVKPLSGVSLPLVKCNFTAAPQAGKQRFLCLFQIKVFILHNDEGRFQGKKIVYFQ